MTPQRRALDALVRSTEALADALERRDDVAIATAMAARDAAYAWLRERGVERDPEVTAVFQRVAARDAAIVAAARAEVLAIEAELRELRELRDAVQRMEPGGHAARFVSERA